MEAVEMAKRLVADSIWKSSRMEGYCVPYEAVKGIIVGISPDRLDASVEEIEYVRGMYKAWEYLLNNINHPLNVSFMYKLSQMLGLKGFIVEELSSYLSSIQVISDPVSKALKSFLVFESFNSSIACLVANKILIENNIGVFEVPMFFLQSFEDVRYNYYKSSDDSDILDFLKRYCLNRLDIYLMVGNN